jgi:hypothetical protein
VFPDINLTLVQNKMQVFVMLMHFFYKLLIVLVVKLFMNFFEV